MPKCLPKGQELIKLAREYTDEEDKILGGDTLSFDIQVMEQKQFMKIVRWLISKGYR
jgi:hypothetical protein